MNFMEDQRIKFEHLGIAGPSMSGPRKPWEPVTEDVVLKALRFIMDPASYPLLVMCHLGRHRTGKRRAACGVGGWAGGPP
jgi:tyrosine-protein phosphatase OCA1